MKSVAQIKKEFAALFKRAVTDKSKRQAAQLPLVKFINGLSDVERVTACITEYLDRFTTYPRDDPRSLLAYRNLLVRGIDVATEWDYFLDEFTTALTSDVRPLALLFGRLDDLKAEHNYFRAAIRKRKSDLKKQVTVLHPLKKSCYAAKKKTLNLDDLYDHDPLPETQRASLKKSYEGVRANCRAAWDSTYTSAVETTTRKDYVSAVKTFPAAFQDFLDFLIQYKDDALRLFQILKWGREIVDPPVRVVASGQKQRAASGDDLDNELYLLTVLQLYLHALSSAAYEKNVQARGFTNEDQQFFFRPLKAKDWYENYTVRFQLAYGNVPALRQLSRLYVNLHMFARYKQVGLVEDGDAIAIQKKIRTTPEKSRKAKVFSTKHKATWEYAKDNFRVGQRIGDFFIIRWFENERSGEPDIYIEYADVEGFLFKMDLDRFLGAVEAVVPALVYKNTAALLVLLPKLFELLGYVVALSTGGLPGLFREIVEEQIEDAVISGGVEVVSGLVNKDTAELLATTANLARTGKGLFDAGIRDTATGGKIHASEPARSVFEPQGLAPTPQGPELKTRGVDNPLSGAAALPLGARGPTIVDLQAGSPTFLRTRVDAVPDSRGVAVETGDYLIHDRGAHPTHRDDLRMSRQIVQNVPDWPRVTSGTPIEKLPSTSDLTPAQLDPANVLFPQTGPVTMLRGPTGEPEAFYPARGGGRRLVPEGQTDVSTLAPTTHPQLEGQVDQAYWRRPFALQKSSPELRAAMGQEINAMLRPNGFIEFRVLRSGDRAVVHEVARNIEGARIVEVNQKQINDFLTSNGKVLPTDPIQAALLREALPDLLGQFSPLGMGTFNSIIRIYKGG